MRTRLMGMLAAVAAATVVALVGGTTPAYAATFTVGPLTSGAFTFSGAAGTTLLTDLNTGTQLTCASSTASGSGVYGTGLSGTSIASITGTTFTSCSGPGGITFTVSHVGTWRLNAVTGDANGATGTITNIVAQLSGPLCSARVTGTVPARFQNSTGPTDPAELVVLPTTLATSQLLISNVSGCLGLLRSGDRASFSGTYSITRPVPLTITSP